MVMVDLAGFTKAIAPLFSMQLAELVDEFYRLMADAIESTAAESSSSSATAASPCSTRMTPSPP